MENFGVGTVIIFREISIFWITDQDYVNRFVVEQVFMR
jgi:hypothetical protein